MQAGPPPKRPLAPQPPPPPVARAAQNPPGTGKKGKRKAAAAARDAAKPAAHLAVPPPPPPSAPGGKGNGKGKAMIQDGRHREHAGKQFCFAWCHAVNGCQEPCPNQRLHMCEFCCTAHRTCQCPSHPTWTPVGR